MTPGNEEFLGTDKPVNRMKPVLSVRILAYNHRAFIRGCVESVLAQQTDFPFEIVIGEDQSTDGTREICQQLAADHPGKIRLMLRSAVNKIRIEGVVTSRFNFVETLKDCRGEFVALLDGDDFWTDPTKLQQQVSFLRRSPDYVLALHDYDIGNTRGKVLRKRIMGRNHDSDISAAELTKGFGFATSTLCFRNALGDLPPEFFEVMNGDVFLISLLGSYGKGRFIAGIRSSVYRLHRNSMYSSLGAARSIRFSMLTRMHMSRYYDRIGQPELARHFDNERAQLSAILDGRINLYLYILKNKLYLLQLKYLGNKLSWIRNFFR